jgi:hypothetical protein
MLKLNSSDKGDAESNRHTSCALLFSPPPLASMAEWLEWQYFAIWSTS